jgi:hypothetical protein
MLRSNTPTRAPAVKRSTAGRGLADLAPVRYSSSSTPDKPARARQSRPQVGFFWFIGRPGDRRLVAESLHLDRAEHYGEHLTHPGGHSDHWTMLATRGRRWLQANGYPDEIAVYDYEDFPRGRVVYNLTDDRFVLYVDPRLRRPASIARLVERFGLSGKTVIVQLDAHYRASPSEADDPSD